MRSKLRCNTARPQVIDSHKIIARPRLAQLALQLHLIPLSTTARLEPVECMAEGVEPEGAPPAACTRIDAPFKCPGVRFAYRVSDAPLISPFSHVRLLRKSLVYA